IKEDKCYVFNGESGAVISLPFSLPTPALLYPYELAKILDLTAEESKVSLNFNLEKKELLVKTESIKIKIRLIDPKEFPNYPEPENLEMLEIEGFLQKIKNASFCTSEDASLPLLQAIKITESAFSSTDQRGAWREASSSQSELLVSKLLTEHVIKLGLEPSNIGIAENLIYFMYPDMIIYGARLADDDKYP